MKDFGSILVIHILRATVQFVNEAPAIDAGHPGVVELRRVLQEEIARLESPCGMDTRAGGLGHAALVGAAWVAAQLGG